MRYSYERIETQTPSPSENAGTTARRKIRAVFITVSIIALSTLWLGLAHAAPRVTCKQVQQWVATYGETNVVAYAKWQGWSDQRISHAKRCLK